MTWDHGKKFDAEKLEDVKPGLAAAGTQPRRGRDTFTCPTCGTRTSSGMEYCIGCGRALTEECPRCGERWRYEYQHSFCPACSGQVLQRDPSEWQASEEPRRGPGWKAGHVTTVEEEGTS